MTTSTLDLLERIRNRQREMQVEFSRHVPIGKPIEIPWPDHPPVPVLVNMPADGKSSDRPFLLNLHGGGFIEGNAMTMGSYCQKLADALDMVVFNVDYRLSPDHVFPWQFEETDAVFDYLLAHPETFGIDPARGAIGGFSAGGTLSAGVAVKRILEEKPGFKCCVLGYPMVSFLPEDNDADSPYPAADADMMKAMDIYANGEARNPIASALLAEDSMLAQFPATILLTCGKDSLCKMGTRFGQRLNECGVTVLSKRFNDAYHGFVEVNREDYFFPDPRKTPEQLALSLEAEQLIIDGLATML